MGFNSDNFLVFSTKIGKLKIVIEKLNSIEDICITGLIPNIEIRGIGTLKKLKVWTTHSTDRYFVKLIDMSFEKIEYLKIHRNCFASINGRKIMDLNELYNLQFFEMNDICFNGSGGVFAESELLTITRIEPQRCDLPKLKILKIPYLSAYDLRKTKNLPSLEVLNLVPTSPENYHSFNIKSLDCDISYLSKFKMLRKIKIHINRWHKEVNKMKMENLLSLEKIDFEGERYNGIDDLTIINCPVLEKISCHTIIINNLLLQKVPSLIFIKNDGDEERSGVISVSISKSSDFKVKEVVLLSCCYDLTHKYFWDLKKLKFSGCPWGGYGGWRKFDHFDFSKLKKLQEIDLYKSKQKSIPTLDELLKLSLVDCEVENFARYSNLKEITIKNGCGKLKSLSDYPRLTKIFFDNLNIIGITKCPMLESMELVDCKLIKLEEFDVFPHLEFISFTTNENFYEVTGKNFPKLKRVIVKRMEENYSYHFNSGAEARKRLTILGEIPIEVCLRFKNLHDIKEIILIGFERIKDQKVEFDNIIREKLMSGKCGYFGENSELDNLYRDCNEIKYSKDVRQPTMF